MINTFGRLFPWELWAKATPPRRVRSRDLAHQEHRPQSPTAYRYCCSSCSLLSTYCKRDGTQMVTACARFGAHGMLVASDRYWTTTIIDPITHLNAAPDSHNRVNCEGGTAVLCVAEDPRPQLTPVVGEKRFLARNEITAKLTHPHTLPLLRCVLPDSRLPVNHATS